MQAWILAGIVRMKNRIVERPATLWYFGTEYHPKPCHLIQLLQVFQLQFWPDGRSIDSFKKLAHRPG